MKTFYRQCALEQEDGTTTVAWLPVEYCDVGKYVEIKNSTTGEWSAKWKVLFMGDITSNPPDYRKLIRSHRKATGDSNPRRDYD